MSTRAEKLTEGAFERRAVMLPDFTLRAAGNGTIEFTGHPSLFAKPYEMYGGPDKGGWMEHVNRDAFTRTLKASPDVSLNVDHGDSLSGLPIARTTAPGPVAKLNLKTDRRGLYAHAPLDPAADDDVRQLQQKMDLGLIAQMSFAFRTVKQAWNADYTERELLELDLHRGDVSIVTNAANPETDSQLRGLDEALDLILSADLAEVRSLQGPKLLEAQRALATMLTGIEDPEPRNTKSRLTVAHARRLALLDA